MENRFFEPYVGESYAKGIKGKKVLVLGASFYCPHTECEFYGQCTDVGTKDSSAFDSICPLYKPYDKLLHNEPSYSVADSPKTYRTFASCMSRYLGEDDCAAVWSHLAFTNYVQFFLPASAKGFRETRWSDLSERDFKAFIETLKELEPDIVIIWGCVINSRIKEENEYVIDKHMLRSTDGYLCHMQLPGVAKTISLLNPYHPSSSAWHSTLAEFDRYFIVALHE